MNDASHSYLPMALQVVVRKIIFFRLRMLPFQKIPGQVEAPGLSSCLVTLAKTVFEINGTT